MIRAIGPLLYLTHVITRHGLQMHQYADDIQVYVSTTVDDAASAVDRFATCVTEIEARLRASRLTLNPTKIQVMWLRSSHQLAKLDINHVRVLSCISESCRTQPDTSVPRRHRQPAIAARVAAVCRSGYYQLRQLRQAVRSLSEDASKTLLQAFVAWSTATLCSSASLKD